MELCPSSASYNPPTCKILHKTGQKVVSFNADQAQSSTWINICGDTCDVECEDLANGYMIS